MNDIDLKFGLQPFWFWNGAMESNEIIRQINEMADKGIKGFFIHPRQGMEIPYLSKEYFDRVKIAVKTAKERGLEVWIYDEYPYPSGISGGEVILDHPEFLCKRLKKEVKDIKGGKPIRMFAPWGKVLFVKAFRLNNGKCDFTDSIELSDYVGTGYQQEVFQYSGLTEYNKKRYFTGDPAKLLLWTPPEGEWRIYFITETVFNHFKYFENFVDPLNQEAVKYYIQTTHEQYKKNIGDEFGKTIKGFFSDEVTPFPPTQPWSCLLPKKVKQLHNIDLIEYLPALWDDMGEITARVRYAYWNTATECFIESYDKSIYQWCSENNLLYVGEKPILRSKELEFVHIPGIDSGHQKVGSKAKVVSERYRSNGKIISSAAHFYHKPGALCEAFHSIGWGMTMQDMKWIFDWLAAQGVNFFVAHGFFYTTDGLKKHDAPPSSFFQMPWWQNMNCLTKYADDLGEFVRNIKRDIKILVIDPVTSSWTANKDKQKALKNDFAKMQNQMLNEQMDYYIIDPQLFAAGTVKVKKENTFFCINDEKYGVILMPPMTNLENCAVERIVEYAVSGGKLCAVSSIPYENIENKDVKPELEDIFQIDASAAGLRYKNNFANQTKEAGNVCFASDINAMLLWLKKYIALDWEIIPKDLYGYDELLSFQGVTKQGVSAIFIINSSFKKRDLLIKNPLNQTFLISIQPYESRIIKEDYLAEKEEKDIYILNIDDIMEVTPKSFNALRLGTWRASLPDGQTTFVDSVPVIDQLELSGLKLPIKQKKYFGCPKELEFSGISIAYSIEFVCDSSLDKSKGIYLVMEPETFLGEWHIELNGAKIIKEDFVKQKFYLDSNLAVNVTDLLVENCNIIKLFVYTDVSYGGIRNPLYLFGDFGVIKRENHWCLTQKITSGTMKDLISLGLPFYSGEIVFEKKVNNLYCDKEFVYIKILDPWMVDTIQLCINGYTTEACAWSPYIFKIPSTVIRDDENILKIILKTTAIGLFEGQTFNQVKHLYKNVGDKSL